VALREPLTVQGNSLERRSRLDRLLVERGLAATRSRASDLIRRGLVEVGGHVVARPGASVAREAAIKVASGASRYVSRGALKLIAALDAWGFAPAGRVVLDAGAGTGGFTQVLLERGAQRVYAVDVGCHQLAAPLRADPRVVALENTDVRALTPELVPEPVAAIVVDLSFISLAKALATPLSLAAPQAWLVALIKPQFEAGRAAIGKGGIVRDGAARLASVERVRDFIAGEGWQVRGVISSPLAGGSGNREFLLGAVRGARSRRD
jgi:23S rRNA (cytidine1920-2'-O)/16S rRNA (cytidine1409-2'-O)-methyltransferase